MTVMTTPLRPGQRYRVVFWSSGTKPREAVMDFHSVDYRDYLVFHGRQGEPSFGDVALDLQCIISLEPVDRSVKIKASKIKRS